MSGFVCTVTVYVDYCASPEEAAAKVESLNEGWGLECDVQIVLPDEPSWDQVTDDEEETA